MFVHMWENPIYPHYEMMTYVVIPAKFFYKIKGFVFVLGMHYLSVFLNNMNYSSIVI